MKKMNSLVSLTNAIQTNLRSPLVRHIALPVGLSLLYAVSSQITIWIPLYHVPLSLQPLPIFLCTLLFGWPAVTGYALYLLEGAVGAPIFAGLQGGIARLLGPTGGFLVGFGIAAAFLMVTRAWQSTKPRLLACLWSANAVYFACALAQLAFFVPSNKLLVMGLYPFIIGDFAVKTGILLTLTPLIRRWRA